MGKMLRIAGMSLSGLMVNRGRSALSMLGIVIGVFAVILLTSLGNGVQEAITGKLTGVGSNLLLISPGNSEAQGDGPNGESTCTSTLPCGNSASTCNDGTRAGTPSTS